MAPFNSTKFPLITRRLILLSTLILMTISSLLGCAISQEGAVDYRKAELYSDSVINSETPQKPTSPEVPSTFLLTPVKLVKQAQPTDDSDAIIKKLDSITIRLRRGLVRYFSEISYNPIRKFEPNGEIAIIMKAFEYGEGEDFNFGPEGIKEGRLVFYSSDVKKGQILNFNNMPIYGPIEYGGNPIGIEISIIELDIDSKKISALLGTLANFGAIAYPPAAPILPVLETLGTSLLKGGTNDIEMRFMMVFDPAEGYEGVSYPTVEAGNYVFVRENDRLKTTNWENLTLDDNTGLLYKKNNGNYEIYRDNTYLTLQINKGFSSKNIDLSQNTFGEFLAKLEDEDAQNAEDLKPFLHEVNLLGMERVQKRNFADSKVIIRDIRNAVKNNQLDNAKNSAYDLSKAIGPAIKAHADSLTVPDSETTAAKTSAADLSIEQTAYLLKAIRSMSQFDKKDKEKFYIEWYQGKKINDIEKTVYDLIEMAIQKK